MLNLIWANIFRLKKNAVFWGSIIVTIGFEIYYTVSQLLHYNKNHDSVSMDTICSPAGLQIIVILAAVTLSLFLGTEYSNKTIRNKQIAGHTRAGIYGAHLFTSLLAVTVLYLTDWVVSSVLISMLFKPSWPSLSSLLLLFFQGWLSFMTYAAVFTCIALLCSSRAATTAICILLAFSSMFLGIYELSKLSESEYLEDFVKAEGNGDELPFDYEEGDTVIVKKFKNPYYLRGMPRRIHTNIFDANPYGQILQVLGMEIAKPRRTIFFSLLFMITISGAGMAVFNRKDLK